MSTNPIPYSERLLFSQNEAANLLGVSGRAIRYAIFHDRLSTIKLGRRRMIAREELLRYARHDQPKFCL
jgi:excisionase family DNA binding protein